jgi:acyl-CoA dehydrogenase
MNSILDAGHQPPVLTAMMKYETTERSRRVVNQGMDVVAGAGICKGPRNILANVYQAIPIGITVEGSNTLTRSLIIFGQGMMKCNPSLYEMVKLLEKKELSVQESARFYSLFFHTLSSTFKNLGNGLLNPFLSRTERYTVQVSVTSLILLFLGKGLKSEQMLTGKMSDILGSLFAIQAMEWYVEHEEKQTNNSRAATLLKEIKSMAVREESLRIETALRGIRDNFPLLFLRYAVLYPLLTFAIPTSPTSDEEIKRLATILTFDANAKEIRSWLSRSIHVPMSIQKMEEWADFPESHPERKKIADEIVAVDVTREK